MSAMQPRMPSTSTSTELFLPTTELKTLTRAMQPTALTIAFLVLSKVQAKTGRLMVRQKQTKKQKQQRKGIAELLRTFAKTKTTLKREDQTQVFQQLSLRLSCGVRMKVFDELQTRRGSSRTRQSTRERVDRTSIVESEEFWRTNREALRKGTRRRVLQSICRWRRKVPRQRMRVLGSTNSWFFYETKSLRNRTMRKTSDKLRPIKTIRVFSMQLDGSNH